MHVLSAMLRVGELVELIDSLPSSINLLKDVQFHQLDLSFGNELLIVVADVEIQELSFEDVYLCGPMKG